MSEQRERIVRAAADLLTRGGAEAVSTRAVSAEAGVQAPAIYRQFADMQTLLHAAAREVFARYLREKLRRTPSSDPVEELRQGWDLHIAFGLANPAAYVLLYGAPAREEVEAQRREGAAMLEQRVQKIAEAGRLRVSVPHAVGLIQAGACGVTLTLINTGERDLRLSHEMRDAVFNTILGSTASRAQHLPARAVALRAVLDEDRETLSKTERALLGEWLDRLAEAKRSR